jgi:hypothetical protein
LKDKLVCHFILVTDMVGVGIREFVYDVARPAFLKNNLVWIGISRSGFKITHMDQCISKCMMDTSLHVQS